MTTREVVLDGGSPWGFRLHGGADLNQPLRISRVNPGSKAALRGIREGDLITSINTRSTRDITNAEAHYLLRNSGDSLKLGLNEECSGSPKRRQYRTVHQETTSETVKRSSRTSHTLTSSKTVSVTAANGNTDNGDCIGHPNPPVAALSSTSSSSSTPSGMADSGRRRRRGRNQRRKARIVEEEVVYRVESPTQVKSPERKKPVKSRSLDDDDLVKIQEVTEVSESEDKGGYFVSEAESETMEEQEPETKTELTLHLAQYTPEQEPLISPEEELTLRNFLEGLNLVNCPEDAFRQVMRETSTMESVKSRRARKRQALEQYFTPIAQNPRFLDVISEETSDLSDREQKSLTQHLKQGTPEPEVPVRRRTSTPILVGSRIISAPVTHQVCSSSEAEVVFLEDSSNSSSPDPKSEHEDEKDTNDDLFSSNNSSVPDLRETEVVEETKRVKFTVKKDDVLVSGSDSTTVLKNLEDAKQIISELTPPPTPDPDSGAETSREDLQPNEDKTEAIFKVFKDEETLRDEIEATSTPVESLEANLAPIIRNIEEDFESLSNEKVTVKDNTESLEESSLEVESEEIDEIKEDDKPSAPNEIVSGVGSEISNKDVEEIADPIAFEIQSETEHNVTASPKAEATKKIFSKVVDGSESLKSSTSEIIKDQKLHEEHRNSQNIVKKVLVRTVPIVIEEYRKEDIKTEVQNISTKLESKEKVNVESFSGNITNRGEENEKHGESPVVTNIPINIETITEAHRERIVPIKIEPDEEIGNKTEEKPISASIVREIPIKIEINEEEKDKPPITRNIPIKIEAHSDKKESGSISILPDLSPKVKEDKQPAFRNIPITIETKNEEKHEEVTIRNIPIKIESNKKETNEREERKITTSIIKDIPISIVCEEEEKDKTQLIKNISIQISAENEEKKEDGKTEKGSEGIEPVVRNIPIKIEPKEEGTKVPVTGRAPTEIVTKSEDVTHNSTIEIKIQSKDKKNSNVQITNIPIKIEDATSNKEKTRKEEERVRNIPIKIESNKKETNEREERKITTSIIKDIPISIVCEEEEKDKTQLIKNISIQILSTENEEKKEEGKTEVIEPVVRNIPIKIEPKEEGAKVPVTGRAPTVIVTKSEDVTHNSTIDIKVQSKDKKTQSTQSTVVRNIPIKIEAVVENENKNRNVPIITNIPIKIEDAIEGLDIKNNSTKVNCNEEGHIIRNIPIRLESEEQKKEQKDKEVVASFVSSNILSPPPPNPSPSPSLSSGSSSRATSLCTAKYNSMSGSVGDITSIKDDDFGTKPHSPLTLRELCVHNLMSQPFGAVMLQELADVSSSIHHITNNLLSAANPKSSIQWNEDPRLLVCLSPTQRAQLDRSTRVDDEASKLLDLHEKFIFRTGHGDAVERRAKNDVEIASIGADAVSNRLLAIIRAAEETAPRKVSANMSSARLRARDLDEWLRHARKGERRASLPHDFYAQQMLYLQEKEREIQRELEKLEDEKQKLAAEMAPQRVFRPEDYHISRKGDFAETRKSRPASMPSEFFRQQMYEEYLGKIAAMEERKQHQVIKVTQLDESSETKPVSGIKDEFMDKVKEKQKLGKLLREEESSDESDKLPKHLQEFMDITHGNRTDGVWTPGQKESSRSLETQRSESDVKDEPLSPVWTPKSATSSPTLDRKEFRPIKYESPVLSRKQPNPDPNEPPWKIPETSSDTGIALSSALEKRLPTSHSAPGFSELSGRLPKAQNPTITLLQKAREGQLPKGASYIEDPNYRRVTPNEKPPLIGPGEILYKIKNEYTSESDGERPRKMADLGPRKFEGIGPTTRDGMPLILRSEVKDANQSKWYKKMYDTIHKQKPHRDEYVTVRYKQRRGQYPYTSGYLSEPEPGAYDSDFTESKYATLDRRRMPSNVSSTMPRSVPPERSSGAITHGHDVYRNQPGRIENYIPGHSSISEKEAREWWDEVMDIFDGWLDDNSALPTYMFSRAVAKSHLEQQKRVPQTKSFMNQALKESGYESDSTLVFRRRDDTAQQISPFEQKEAYKHIQKGGDIPLHGLRKPAPERPKEEPQLEYFPISPTLTRIRVHKNIKPQTEILCYPVTVHPHPSSVFAHYKRTAPSGVPPSPPRRKSSRNNSTLRLISTMKVKTDKLPVCKRHETCFSTTTTMDKTNVKYLRDKITCKLAPAKGKPKMKVSKVVTASPELKTRIVSTLTTTKDPKTATKTIQSRTNVVGSKCCTLTGSLRKPCKKCTTTKIFTPQTKTFGTEKRKVDLTLPKLRPNTIVSSPDLLSPTEVKKAVERSLPAGTVFKKSNALLASVRNGTATNLKEVVLPIKVGVSEKGKTILRTNLRNKSLSPIPSERSKHRSSLESLRSPQGTKRIISTVGKTAPKSVKAVKGKPVEIKKMKKAKKEEINGEIVKKGKELVPGKCAGRAAGSEIVKKLREMDDSEFGSTDTLTDLQKQKEAIQTDYFFQHLFLRDLPSPTPSTASRTSWLLERYQLSQRRSEPTISAMKVYLKHTKPVTDSKFRSLDMALSRSRSASPKSVTWELQHVEKRSSSLPPKLVFSQTSRPVSPKVERRFTRSPTPPPPRSPSSRKIMQLKSESPKPKHEMTIYSCPSISQSSSSIDSYDRKEYQSYVKELLRSSRRSPRFKDLNDFYSAIEKFGELEQKTSTANLKPRRRFEDEIIDYERWREVRTRERAERELKTLVDRLREDSKEKGFLFSPKEIDAYRWKKELDRGLRVKEKSVDNIKEEFERLKSEESERESARRRELACLKDTYKPLWRGDSVLGLANRMVERRAHSEGRVAGTRQKLIDSERMLTHGIGSRLWSSLSSEQVNILKNQLSEIYSQNLQKKKTDEFSVHVPEKKVFQSSLTVRRNSDSIQDKVLSEPEKKCLSQSISREVLDHVNKRVLPLVLAKEESEEQPCKALVKTDATSTKMPSSETESGSTDESNKTVIHREEIKKKVEYFETVADQEKYTPTVYKPCESLGDVSSTDTEPSLRRRSITSRSYQNLKEFFGEKELMRIATLPLSATRKPTYVSPERPNLRVRVPSPSISEATSIDSVFRSRSISPYPEDALTLVRNGEVRRLRSKFEGTKLKRSKSDSNLYRPMYGGDVELLRSKYEYPAHAGRGRSRLRRGGVVSPTFLRAEDRFMPHINIISKIASLYARKNSPHSRTSVESWQTGDVDKMRRKFDVGRISLLGHMFTSSPELRDITPYLAASWIAHRFPRSEDNTRSLSSPESSVASRDTSRVRRDRPKSASPSRKSSILKTQAHHQQADTQADQRYKSWWNTRPSVSFKEPEPPLPPPKGHHGSRNQQQESPRKYVENEVTIHYKTPVRQEIKEYLSEDELAYRQAEAMKRIYQEERRRKYLQVSKSLQELQDMNSRRHTDNFIPSQKSPIPLNRYDDFDDLSPPVKPRPRSPEPRLLARALYNFVGQTARELTFRKGDLIYVRRQVDKNWYEGELNAMLGLFPVNYVEIVTYDTAKTTPRKSHEGQARAKYNFVAQTHLELSLAKGELVVVTRRVDDNWFEGKIGGRKGIFPVSYVDLLVDPGDPPVPSTKPVAAPASHSMLLNGSAGGKQSMGSHSYTPTLTANQLTTSYRAKPVQVTGGSYGSLHRTTKSPVSQALHIETQSEPVPYRAMYKYLPQNDDELELFEGDTVFVLEKCDDGWFVGSSERTGAFGTFPGNYVEKI